MRIISAASAFPSHYYSQTVLLEALKHRWAGKINAEQVRLLERLHSRVEVQGRHLAYPLPQYEKIETWGQANDLWIKAAEELGQQALCRALEQAGLQPSNLSALFFVSITGVASPSIDARLVNRMKLSPHIKRLPIFGLGCVAGAAGVARAADYVRAFPDQVAAVLSVELCSLTIQFDDFSVANMISSGLFGDGAAAVLVAGADFELTPGPSILATRSVFYPDTENVMGWSVSEKGFQIVLSEEVPRIAAHLATDIDAFLADEQLTRADIGSWILHTGGPKILEATAQGLGLPKEALDVSWQCLSRVGNLSSASVLVVLEEFMTKRKPKPGTYSILAAMGPGFCAELVLLRW